MIGKLPEKGQHDLFRPMLDDFIEAYSVNSNKFGF